MGICGKGDPNFDTSRGHNDSGSVARFFYCAKASKTERGENNTWPTVKPLTLMKYLITLITPPRGIVLDPFGGSGTTALACESLNFRWILINQEIQAVEIAKERIILKQKEGNTNNE